jgi:hypothetical protein
MSFPIWVEEEGPFSDYPAGLGLQARHLLPRNRKRCADASKSRCVSPWCCRSLRLLPALVQPAQAAATDTPPDHLSPLCHRLNENPGGRSSGLPGSARNSELQDRLSGRAGLFRAGGLTSLPEIARRTSRRKRRTSVELLSIPMCFARNARGREREQKLSSRAERRRADAGPG